MQNLVGVAYALATHEECAVIAVTCLCASGRRNITIIRLSVYCLPIRWLPTVLNILCIRFFGLYQRTELQTGQHHVGDGLFEEAAELGFEAVSFRVATVQIAGFVVHLWL